LKEKIGIEGQGLSTVPFFLNNLKVQQKNTFDFAFPRLRTFSKLKCLRCEFLADVWASFWEVLLEGGVLSTLVELFFL